MEAQNVDCTVDENCPACTPAIDMLAAVKCCPDVIPGGPPDEAGGSFTAIVLITCKKTRSEWGQNQVQAMSTFDAELVLLTPAKLTAATLNL